MPAALDVDREAIKTLAIAVGITEASKQTGVSHEAIRQWSSREGWFKQPALPPTISQPVTNVTKPSQALVNVLAERKDKSLLNMTEYVVKASGKGAKEGKLTDAQAMRHVSAIYQAAYPEKTEAGVQLAILNVTGSME